MEVPNVYTALTFLLLLLPVFANIITTDTTGGGILSHLKPRVLSDTLGLPLDSTILKPRVTLGFRD
jgi:hypothetical protein